MPFDIQARVIANRALSADYNVLSLAAPEIAKIANPGQFLMVKASRGVDPLLRRPFSIFEVLRDDGGEPTGLTIFSKRIGRSTALIYDAAPGASIACLGPLGNAWPIAAPPSEAWLVAGGVGLAAFATLAEVLQRRGVKTTLFYGARTAGELFCLDLFRSFGASLVLTTEDGSGGERGRVTGPLERRLAAKPPSVMIYACGPEPLLQEVATLAARHGRPSQLAMERVMGCGMGGCFSCVVRVREADGTSRYVRSCIEGPVFRGEDVVWE